MTLKEAYSKVTASEELKEQFAQAAKSEETLKAWLADQGVEATIEELYAFLKEKSSVESGEIPDDDLEAVAGGKGSGAKNIESNLPQYCHL